MLINAMGYSGTGSSAIVHLLSEYENTVEPQMGKYEHVVFYTPNGLFDLEDRLLLNNTIHNADAAINDFYKAMKRLNDNDFGWFGNYQKIYGDRFMKIVDDFISEITDFTMTGYWSNDFVFEKNIFAAGRDVLKSVAGRPIAKFGCRLNRKGDGIVRYSFIGKERFYTAAKKFVQGYCELINPDHDKSLIVDQLLLPHNLYRIPRYFDEDVRCVVCDRDPRDMFVLSKYIWPRMGSPLLFPDEVHDFVRFYQGLYGSEIQISDPRILRLHFEDLVYQYEETVKKIEDFIGTEYLGKHSNAGHVFIPENSKKNTQNFRINAAWENEVSYITESMEDSIYSFPYTIKPNIEETTDP